MTASLPDFLLKESPKPLAPQLEEEEKEDLIIGFKDDRYKKMRELPHALQQFLWALSKVGKVKTACGMAGISQSIVYRARKNTPAFRDMFDDILAYRQQVLVAKLEGAAYQRAVKGVKKGVWYKGDLVGYEKQYSDSLLTTLLKANDPEKYRERSQVDYSGEVGIGMNLLVVPAVQSVEDWSKNQGDGIVIEQKSEDG